MTSTSKDCKALMLRFRLASIMLLVTRNEADKWRLGGRVCQCLGQFVDFRPLFHFEEEIASPCLLGNFPRNLLKVLGTQFCTPFSGDLLNACC